VEKGIRLDLSGQLALITGGSRGIGAATAVLMARAGADIAILYRRDRMSAMRVGREVMKNRRRFLALKVDVSDAVSVRRAVTSTVERFGRIDILVNNAGIWTYAETGAMKKQVLQETLKVNLEGVFNMCNEVAVHMKKRGRGKIVNVASTAGQRGEAFHSHYAAAKGGVIALTKSLAVELIPYNIHVNCVSPGWVDTEMVADALADVHSREEVRRSIPRGRIASPEEIAGPILFLVSHLAENIVGAVLNVNGGSVLSV
jgi:3-oxoacyl-[acyl-carrier protein] reductase